MSVATDYQAELDRLAKTMHGPNGPAKLGKYSAVPKTIKPSSQSKDVAERMKHRAVIKYKMNTDREGAPRPDLDFRNNAGIDLYAADDIGFDMTPVGGVYLARVPTTFSIELPEGVHAMVAGRSGNAFKRGTIPFYGIIDNSYRGDIVLHVYTHNDTVAKAGISFGTAIAQLVLLNYSGVSLVDAVTQEVAELGSTERGERGFGETTGRMV